MHSVVKVTVVVPVKSLGWLVGEKKNGGRKITVDFTLPIKVGTLEHVSTLQISFQAHVFIRKEVKISFAMISVN